MAVPFSTSAYVTFTHVEFVCPGFSLGQTSGVSGLCKRRNLTEIHMQEMSEEFKG